MGGRGKADKRGRSTKLPPFTPLIHDTMDSLAFRSLTPLAQCIYLRLLRRAGYKGARNGDVFYSVREAAAEFNVSKDTASAAFHLLQARGFIVPTQLGHLGVEGEGKAKTWRLTDLPTPTDPSPTREYQKWRPGADFPVVKARPPRHKQKPVPASRTACPSGSDVGLPDHIHMEAACPSLSDDGAVLEALPVLQGRTPEDLPGGRGQKT